MEPASGVSTIGKGVIKEYKKMLRRGNYCVIIANRNTTKKLTGQSFNAVLAIEKVKESSDKLSAKKIFKSLFRVREEEVR